MTAVKKIDWLRHLFYEATKWKYSVTGQVKWSELKVKDPNNGSKMTVTDLETALPNMLNDCLENDQVPFEYFPEIRKFLSYSMKEEKFDNKSVSKLVQTRKETVGLIETLKNYEKLSDADKGKVMSKVDTHDLVSLKTVVQNVKTRLQGLGITHGTSCAGGVEHDRCSKFKMIDWLRHMYVKCQKWLTNKQGQLQWRNINAQDPNNSKDGNRMKMDELKQSLKVLVPSLEESSVPRAYQWEISQVRRVLCDGDGDFNKENLEAEENLRKISIKIGETLVHLEKVVLDIAPTKLPWMFMIVSDLEQHFRRIELDTDVKDGVVVESDKDFLDDEIILEEQLDANMIADLQADDISEMHFDGSTNSAESDGTEYLEKIIEEATQEQNTFPVESPASPSSQSEGFSEVTSPAPHLRSSVDDHFSDDSGYDSPLSNPLDLEDPDELDDIDDNLIKGLDFSALPDVIFSDTDEDPFASDIETNYAPVTHSRKRKFSTESYGSPVTKRARP